MLRVSELHAALVMTESLGQRRYGHFDHNAHAATGPFPASPRVAPAGAHVELVPAESVAPGIEQFVDEKTGQPLFRQRPEESSR